MERRLEPLLPPQSHPPHHDIPLLWLDAKETVRLGMGVLCCTALQALSTHLEEPCQSKVCHLDFPSLGPLPHDQHIGRLQQHKHIKYICRPPNASYRHWIQLQLQLQSQSQYFFLKDGRGRPSLAGTVIGSAKQLGNPQGSQRPKGDQGRNQAPGHTIYREHL
jgi:hypothetical protein